MSADSKIIDIAERLAVLEAEHAAFEKQHAAMDTKLDTLLLRFAKYEGRWGGIVMVVSAITALLIALKTEILKWVFKHE